MSEGIFITKVDFNQLLKKFAYLESYVKNSVSEKRKSKWISQEEAMEQLGCKQSKLKQLRFSGAIHWKTTGKGRGVMILRKSVEDYNDHNSTIFGESGH